MIRQLQNAGPTVKIILGALLVLICASMAITLIPGGIGSSLGIGAPPAGVLATVGDQQVTVPEVQREARAMIRQQFPRGGPQAAMLMPYFSGQAAEQLINEKTLIAEARHLGLRVSDDELRDELQHGQLGSMLFPDGKFVGQEEYENFVQRNDLTVPQFEALEKDYILVRKLRALVSTSAFVGDAEVRDEFSRRSTKVKFEYAVVTQADILKGLHPAEAELKAYYESHKAAYNNSIPEKRQIKYIVVDSAKVAAAATVNDQDLQAYYDQHRDEYRLAEKVKVSHILFKTPLLAPGAKEDEKAVADVRAKAEGVLKELKAGGDFAKLAEKYSDDPASAKTGGELGWLGRGRAGVPEFDKAAFSLAKGQTSDLIKSSFGFQIIRVEDKQEAHLKTLAEVKSEVEEKVKLQKTARATEAMANALLSLARTDGFDKAAAAKGQTAVTTEFFSRTDNLPGLAANPQFMEAVFNEGEKAPADVVQIPQGYVVFQLLAIKPPATPSFEEIRARVESEFKNERAAFLLQQKTQELSDRAKAAHDLKKAAKDLGATVKTSELVLPDGQVPDIGSMANASAIFSLNPGEISAPITAGGNGVVAQLLEKQAPTDQEFAAKKDEIRQSLLEAKQNDLFGLFVTNLRKDMEKSNRLKVNQEEMKNLTRQAAQEGS
ncbi:MAG TPA: peptidyl-prolyl cis-trans isomerase [Terriglobales bacterium]|nr:peptidyl-prolyl cis-trans isomerase [Terriglobales bacterium]